MRNTKSVMVFLRLWFFCCVTSACVDEVTKVGIRGVGIEMVRKYGCKVEPDSEDGSRFGVVYFQIFGTEMGYTKAKNEGGI